MSSAELLELANEALVPAMLGDRVIVSGEGVHVEDADGRRYIDCISGPGVLGMGHSHPVVSAAIAAQLERLVQAPGGLLSAEAILLANRLSELLPAPLRRSYFVNSGAEAVELCVKLAVKYQRSQGRSGLGLLALREGFHGRSALALSLTGLGPMKSGMASYAAHPAVHHLPTPYCYRCPLRPATGGCCDRTIVELEETIRHGPTADMCAIVIEPIQGVGGVIVPPDDFLPRVQEVCRREGILLIVDEIFTGFGRTGKLFGHQHWGIAPDLMAVGKFLGGGLPLAAAIASDEVALAFQAGDHYTTFGGNNALACAAGLAALDVLIDEDLVARAAATGTRFLRALQEVARQSAFAGDVRGLGLILAIELVEDRESRRPAPSLARTVRARLLERGVLLGLTGEFGNILRITPPLTIGDGDVDEIVAAIADSLDGLEASLPGRTS
jgi:4-aminobutyrate aminotransferase-like enzyme